MMKSETIVIKKYENRRLYDTVNSRYINLEDVAKLLQEGGQVRVVDAASGEDITRLILTQIIVEDAKGPNSNFPVDILRDMVIASGRASQESALKYMKTMMELYQSTYRVMAPPVAPFDLRPRDEPAAPAKPAPADPVRGSKGNENATAVDRGDVGELKQRVAELEALVTSLAVKKRTRKKR